MALCLNKTGRIVFATWQMKALLGLRRVFDDLVGHHFLDFVSEQSLQQARTQLRAFLLDGQRRTLNVTFVTADGRQLGLLTQLDAVNDGRDRVVGATAVFRRRMQLVLLC